MTVPFERLTPAEKIKFWQEIAEKLQRVLELCQDQITPAAQEEIRDYLAHNELGLAWETLCDRRLVKYRSLPQPAREILAATGQRMGFDKPGNRNYARWAEIRQSAPTHGPEQPRHSDF